MHHQQAGRRAAAESPLRILFDVESLLLDPAEGMRDSLRAAMRKSGLIGSLTKPAPAASESELRPMLQKLLAQCSSGHGAEQVERTLQVYCRHFNEHGRYRCRFRNGSLRLLATLIARPEIELHYLTHIGAGAAARVLDVYGLQHLPRTICTGERFICPGLRPMLIRDHVISTGVPPSYWILLSEHPPELLAALNLGIRCIGLGYGRASACALDRLPVDAIAADLDEVAFLLRSTAGKAPACAPSAFAIAGLH